MTRSRIVLHAVLAAFAVAAPPRLAHADAPASVAGEPSAESPGERAARHFAAERWDEAIEALIEAYALDPDPDYLYARAQAERFRGRCPAAIVYYKRFLDSDPSLRQREDTERNIVMCEQLVADAEPPPPRVDPSSVTQSPRERPPAPAPRDVAGAVLVTIGAIATAAGASVWIAGARVRARAPDADHEATYVRTAARGRTLTGVGIGVTSVGVATLLAGIIRYAVVMRRARTRSR
jgi:tetratricopeptide (TPR) repeat protein